MAEAVRLQSSGNERRETSSAAVAAGEIIQLQDGRAGVFSGINAAASGDVCGYMTEGVFTVAKTASMVIVEGQSVWWDHSANKATITPSKTDRDFFLGTAWEDAATAATTLPVNLNVCPAATVDLAKDGYDKAVVLTSGTAAVEDQGGVIALKFSATAEAQKVDAISKTGFALASNWVVEGAVEFVDDGDDAALDFNIGVANATHATDADSITESVFFHVDGNVLNILAESDDGTNEQAATDTTVDQVLGTRWHFCIDGRDPSDVQLYINGVLVLGDKTFNVSAATGPLYLLVHMEKTSNDTLGEVHVDWMRCITSQG